MGSFRAMVTMVLSVVLSAVVDPVRAVVAMVLSVVLSAVVDPVRAVVAMVLSVVLSAVVDPVRAVVAMVLSVVLSAVVDPVRAVVAMVLSVVLSAVVDPVRAVIVIMLLAVVDSVRDVVVMASSFKELILSGSVCTDRLTVASPSCMLCWPNIRVLSPVEITTFLMLLGDQLVLLYGKWKKRSLCSTVLGVYLVHVLISPWEANYVPNITPVTFK